MVNFPTWIPDYDSYSLALLDLFVSSDASICSTMAFPVLGNSHHTVVSVSSDFLINSKQDTPFHRVAYDYSHADSPALLDFSLLTLVFVLQWLSLQWEILIMLLPQFPLTF